MPSKAGRLLQRLHAPPKTVTTAALPKNAKNGSKPTTLICTSTSTPPSRYKAVSKLSLTPPKRAEKDTQKKAAKAEAAEVREKNQRPASKVYIKHVGRNKRKYVTEISGLEAFG
ncbi:Translation machinery-associated protein 22 [Elasticomyces elasticus]|nr:Translation machinery-associated protein 22 [Elasticomyces elasticus]